MKIVVLMGGVSGERAVSLASGVQVARGLREAGHEVVAVDTSRGVLTPQEEARLLEAGVMGAGGAGDPGGKTPAPPPAGGVTHPGLLAEGRLPSDPQELWRHGDLLGGGDVWLLRRDPRLADADLLFPVLHGGRGEDGTLQTLLELVGIPFAGSGRVGCTLAMDKDVAKRLFREAGIPTAPWLTARDPKGAKEVGREALGRLGLPLIVKPVSGGSTLGLTLVKTAQELEGAVEVCLNHDDGVLFEKYVAGRELTVGILGEEALPVGEIIPRHELFDYECKYVPGMADEIFPADLPEEAALRVRTAALAVHRTLGLRDFSRVDFILDADGVPWCLEANALPGFTANSLLPKAARAAGIPFPELCHRIARMARERAAKGGNRPRG